jgi:diaminopimelate epimerase
MIEFRKYHCLGNDYLVIEPDGIDGPLTTDLVRYLCDRRRGVGSDGVLFGPLASSEADFGLRIFNPDGSEAEKSGNGLRIFARYLWDLRKVKEAPFSVHVPGGLVHCQVQPGGKVVKVWMGSANFSSAAIPTGGPDREVVNETLEVGNEKIRICALTLGNPHCVVLDQVPTEDLALRLGPKIENHRIFPNRANVQFVRVIDRSNLEIQIWERGAGYTLASGSSACAAAASAYRLGWCAAQVSVQMPGGKLNVEIGADGMIVLTGPVTRVYEGKAWGEENR